jgi:aryl-alcohol dehydrogenase-like predicted oxidoreductase
MNHRHLGQSGLVVSEIAYGNWITHGLQVENDAAIACVRAALEEGITTFDTADIYTRRTTIVQSYFNQRR